MSTFDVVSISSPDRLSNNNSRKMEIQFWCLRICASSVDCRLSFFISPVLAQHNYKYRNSTTRNTYKETERVHYYSNELIFYMFTFLLYAFFRFVLLVMLLHRSYIYRSDDFLFWDFVRHLRSGCLANIIFLPPAVLNVPYEL